MMANDEPSTRERILRVAEAFFGDRGYHGTRLHEIAGQVGIQKASLFHHFASKEKLYRAVLDAETVEIEGTIRRVLETKVGPFDKIQKLIEAYVDLVAARPARTRILLRQSIGDAPAAYTPPAEARRVLDEVVAFIADGQRARVFGPFDPLGLVLSIVGMVAFFFTSGQVMAPDWLGASGEAEQVERVKRHVASVARRCLEVTEVAPRVAV